MKKRILLSGIIGLVWVFLLIVVLITPVEWPIYEGKILSASHAVHPATGVSADTPLLCVEDEESLVKNNYTSLGTTGYLAEDVKIDSLHLANRDRFFTRDMCHAFRELCEPVMVNPDSVQPQEGWDVQQIEGNKVTLRHADGSMVSYAYSCLPQYTTVYYSGVQRGNELQIDEYETEIYCSSFAIRAKKGALDASYSLYRDGLEGKIFRVAFCFVSLLGGLGIPGLLHPEISTLLRSLRFCRRGKGGR